MLFQISPVVLHIMLVVLRIMSLHRRDIFVITCSDSAFFFSNDR